MVFIIDVFTFMVKLIAISLVGLISASMLFNVALNCYFCDCELQLKT
ncbi:hypothetical protein FORC066_2878 [Yersinia enterocolitica]|nr:hypothetical protein FORC066_2878 [Yersinia enterocolitica]